MDTTKHEDDKNIRVSPKTWTRLTKRGKKGQSYDDIINELLDKVGD